MGLIELVANIISLAVNVVACGVYVMRIRSSKSHHYMALLAISALTLVVAIIGLATSKWLWQVDVALDVFRKAVVLHLIYLWILSMHETLGPRMATMFQKATMALALVYVAFNILSAFGALSGIFNGLSLAVVIGQAAFCAYLWQRASGDSVGLRRKQTQIMRLGVLTALFALSSILALAGAGILAAIASWIWVGVTLYPNDALLFYQDKPSAFDPSSRAATTIGTSTFPTATAQTAEAAV
ncbi:hypothetical protein THASP1DRAFT_29315 [Thamnocephalis sphaerospora]|uniref:Uncharacterized protein n=1 Tax=Thamnocephalis sphaerospora TaxID=78915 RepID=A0A4P9XS09_9FUNG|nr:hypothetical protein THASP1DRAFT_29315 [Thamnocephalis sphaerospora]|eukprot:RKP08904.1 hypothetical protein THASP1DRAFT_29315 [Thamnocephalis sphaerospora]